MCEKLNIFRLEVNELERGDKYVVSVEDRADGWNATIVRERSNRLLYSKTYPHSTLGDVGLNSARVEQSKEAIATGAWISWLTYTTVANKLTDATSRGDSHDRRDSPPKNPPPQNPPQGDTRRTAGPPLVKGPCGENDIDPVADSMKFPHDYKCTEVPSKAVMGIACPVEVDLTSCCQDHDIALWCSPKLIIPHQRENYIAMTSHALGLCILGKYMDAWSRKRGWCKFLDFLPDAAQAAVNAVAYDVATRLTLLWIMSWKPYSEWEQYMPFDGRNADGCLCGGTKSTVKADEPCVDLCARHGKAQDCYQCHWECRYKDGKPTHRDWVRDPTGQKPCCPGTTRQCTKDCDQTNLSGCSTCFNCHYLCGMGADGRWLKKLVTSTDGRPCCANTPQDKRCPPVGGVGPAH